MNKQERKKKRQSAGNQTAITNMHIIHTQADIEWLPKPNEVRWVLSDTMPPLELISTVLAFIFDGEKILLSDLRDRGWDIPGGHREMGEYPEETVRREVQEETGAEIKDLVLLGHQHLLIRAPKPRGYAYPHPEAYQIFYVGRVAGRGRITMPEETFGCGFFLPDEARATPRMQINLPHYEAALALIRSGKS
jgi:8-oxo-dGTP pyrophosphatase MutT (NUDIX family)